MSTLTKFNIPRYRVVEQRALVPGPFKAIRSELDAKLVIERMWQELEPDQDTEVMLFVFLDNNKVPCGYRMFGPVAENMVAATYSAIIRTMLLSGVKKAIVAHNHPDRGPASMADRDYIEGLRDAASYFNIQFPSAFVVSGDRAQVYGLEG